MTDERLAQIRELAEKAKSAGEYLRENGICMRGGELAEVAPNGALRKWRFLEEVMEAFAAEARTAIPELLTLLDEQKKRIEELNKQLMAWENREGAVCPEDVSFEELIEVLRKEVYEAQARASRAEQALKDQAAKRADILLNENCLETIKRLTATGGEEIGFGGVMGGIRLLWNGGTSVSDVARHASVLCGILMSEHVPTDDEGAESFTQTVAALNDSLAHYYAEQARALSSLPPPPQTQKWIPVGEKLPERKEWALCLFSDGTQQVNQYIPDDEPDADGTKTEWWDLIGDSWGGEVTHWQPLPTPPEEEKA